MSEYDPKLPWMYRKNNSRDWIEDAEGNTVVFDVGHLDGPLIVQAMNSHNELVKAVKRIAHLGANPITEHGCESRIDFMKHCDKMWRIALEEVGKLETKKQNNG